MPSTPPVGHTPRSW